MKSLLMVLLCLGLTGCATLLDTKALRDSKIPRLFAGMSKQEVERFLGYSLDSKKVDEYYEDYFVSDTYVTEGYRLYFINDLLESWQKLEPARKGVRVN